MYFLSTSGVAKVVKQQEDGHEMVESVLKDLLFCVGVFLSM